MRHTWMVVIVALAASATTASAAPKGGDRCGQMHMTLEKTVVDVDVLDLRLRVDDATAERIRDAAGMSAPDELKDKAIIDAVMDADTVVIDMRFERDADLDQFLDGVNESLAAADEAGMIRDSTKRDVSARLPGWYRPVAERGFEKGDHLRYKVSQDRIDTTLRSAKGDVLLDTADRGAERRKALLAGYFAPGTDFRAPLLDSVRTCAGR